MGLSKILYTLIFDFNMRFEVLPIILRRMENFRLKGYFGHMNVFGPVEFFYRNIVLNI